jgi:broad specificity phosphatase PhoE
MQSFIGLVVFTLLIVSAMSFKIGVDDADVHVIINNVVASTVASRACITIDDGHTTTEHTTPLFLVRLHLIRHGETQANVQGIVLGHQDSPLTEKGWMEAKLAASSDTINGRDERCLYWRMYCSDLTRAHTTARIVLGLDDDHGGDIDDDNDDVNLISDPRLREIAKSAREGFLKRYTTDEALAIRRREAAVAAEEVNIPKLETVESVLSRAIDWIDSIVDDATNDYYSTKIERREKYRNCDILMNNEPKIYNIFALSLSAFIRTMIQEMVGQQLPKDFHKTSEGSLDIPNLSRTIIDIRLGGLHIFVD